MRITLSRKGFRLVFGPWTPSYDGIDDFVAFDLSGEKRPVAQVLVGEFHSPAVCKRFNPLFVWPVRISSSEIRVCRGYTLFGSSETTPLISSQLRGFACFYAFGETPINICQCLGYLGCGRRRPSCDCNGIRDGNAEQAISLILFHSAA